MVEMFYTDHGLPIEEDKQWMASKYSFSKEADEKYKNVLPLQENILSLHRHREPRFYAMIAGDRTLWYRKTSNYGTTQYEALPMYCWQGEIVGSFAKRYDESQAQNITGLLDKKMDKFQIFKVTITRKQHTALLTRLILFRLAELYLAAAEAWNEYEGLARKYMII